MANPNPSFQSKRVKRRNQLGITSDRYEFLGLDQAEPDLGDPLIGVSSVGANPFPIGGGDPFILVSDGSGSGKRYWTQKANIISGGVLTPGAISVYGNGNLAPGTTELSIFKLNFTGAGVTVTGFGTDRADVNITVTDVSIPSGQTGSVGYRDSGGKLQGSNTFIFNPTNNRVGIGSTVPRERLDVLGNAIISNNLLVGSAITSNSLKTNFLEVDKFTIDNTTIAFKVTQNAVGIGTTLPLSTLDVRGTANISGYTTVGNLRSNGEIITQTLTSTSTASVNSLSIGSTQVISSGRQLQNITSLDATTTSTIESAIANAPNTFTNLNVTGVTTLSSVGVTGITTTNDFVVTGVATISNRLNSTGITSITNLQATNIFTTGISTFISIGVTGLTTSRNLTVTGITTVNNFFVGSGATVSIASSVGIGTTVARYTLDVNGNIGFTGALYTNNSSGTAGQVLISNGLASPSWGSPSEVTAGSATSVTTIDRTGVNNTFYLTFANRTTGSINQSISLDSDNLAYNPSTNRLGIGTTTPSANLNVSGSTLLSGTNIFSGITTISSTLDIDATGIRYIPSSGRLGIGTTTPSANLNVSGSTLLSGTNIFSGITTVRSQLNIDDTLQFTTGIITTTSTSTVNLDTLNTSIERSSRYNIQITCNGQLIGSGVSASSRSVTNLIGGKDYVSGNYTNIDLTTIQGSGNDARANILVSPEAILTLNAISNGEFAFAQDVSSLNVNKPILFNQAIPPSAAENSRVTSITVTNPGSGYTAVPGVAVTAPTNNPAIPGVSGIGSTATAEVSTMIVSNFTVATQGIHSTIPTITFNGPVGFGTTATGIVGFGISTIAVTTSGSNYSFIPTVSVPGNVVGTSATASVIGLNLTNVNINNTGFGYTGISGANYPVITIQPPTSGTTAIANVTTLGISTYFSITNPGVGYTRPPLLNVASPGIGTTATVGNTLGVVTFTDIQPGSGYTVSPTLSLSPSVTNFTARVGMGISSAGIQLFGGGGYDSNPTISFISVGGIGTGAQATAQISIGGVVETVTITNPGFGYTTPPIVVFSGGTPEVSAAATITQLILRNIEVQTIGFGVTAVPSAFLTPIGALGNGASATPVMGIGTVFVTGFGTGYTSNPSIAVTAFDGITGSGASVVSLGLGVTTSNILVTNPGAGYTFIPSISISSPIGIGTSARASAGVGITQVRVTNPGIGYTLTIPSVSFSAGTSSDTGSGVGAAVSTIITTNVIITNSGAGYTQFDLAQSGIATFNPSGTTGTVGFGVSTIRVTNFGIGYTSAQAARITINPPIGSGITATASANLGFPGILPGPGYGVTTKIYYIASVPTSSTLRLSNSPGIGTLTQSDVANVAFSTNNPSIFAGGTLSDVSIVSPGSGYTSGSILSVINTFDNSNVGSGFSFVASPVNNFQVSDVMLLSTVGSANSTAEFIEYSTLANEEILGSFSVSSGIGATLQFTPTYRNNSIRIARTRFTI